MRERIASAAAAAILSTAQALAQQPQVSEAEAHIASAFTSQADPRVLAQDVKLGPALRGELGDEADSGTIYRALIERIGRSPPRVNLLPPAEAARYASLVGSIADPLVVLEAGELTLLMQYAAARKAVAFVELLSKPAPRAEPKPEPAEPPVVAPHLPPEAPKPPTVVEVPLPPVPPVPPAPPVVETPTPVPPVVEKPAPVRKAPPAAAAPPAAPPRALVLPPPAALAKPEKPRPRGECVIKPVMTEEDLWNCSAPTRPTALQPLPPPVAAQKPQPPAVAAPSPKPPAECVIKPVMTDEELRACASVPAQRAAVVPDTPSISATKPQPAVAPVAAPKPPAECVIKPVMTDEELRTCASVPVQRITVAPDPAPAVKLQPTAAQPQAPKPPAECVIKPVMTDEELRACASVPTQRMSVAPDAPPPAAKPQPTAAQPQAPKPPAECVIKPVMTQDDLRACGAQR